MARSANLSHMASPDTWERCGIRAGRLGTVVMWSNWGRMMQSEVAAEALEIVSLTKRLAHVVEEVSCAPRTLRTVERWASLC
jgi:hypothetical protein